MTVFVDGVLWESATPLRRLRAADVMQARLLTDREPEAAHALRAGSRSKCPFAAGRGDLDRDSLLSLPTSSATPCATAAADCAPV